MNIILVGPPGTGKGTMAKLVEKELGLKHISVGDLLREEVKNNSELGKEVAPIMRAGKLVDDSFVAKIIASNVPKFAKKGFILDGFPRTQAQAEFLEKIYTKKEEIDVSTYVVDLEITHDEAIKRLTQRYEEQGRADDKPEFVKKRLEIYSKETQPLLAYFKENEWYTFITINGQQPIDDLSAQIIQLIELK